ncbi:hypothetical protein [Saccharothrix obliqua]|uniref:hypothetical protein n=1 Tax=Saccharothrix obliqua TaxID=2861747 RepID=UPI001C5FC2E4|nr:hypothetical protein [Saccharothrix obliqua]MBW4718706.1 hypothetical protein [Saccharothrix obliqua]
MRTSHAGVGGPDADVTPDATTIDRDATDPTAAKPIRHHGEHDKGTSDWGVVGRRVGRPS